MALAELFTVAHNCFKIMTSTQKIDKADKMKNSLEVNLDEQLPQLDKLKDLLTNMRFSGKPRFHKGMKIAMECAKQLQQYLAQNHNIDTLTLSSIIQDFLESFFGVIRGMGGANNNPDTFMFLQRVKHYVTQKLLEDDDFDIFSIKEKLEEERDLSDMEHDRVSDAILPKEIEQKAPVEEEDDFDNYEDNAIDVDEEILDEDSAEIFKMLENSSKKSSMSEEVSKKSYEQGILHLAASIANKFRDDETLGTTQMKSQMKSTMYSNGVNKGGLLDPTEEWLSDVKKMDEIFMNYHPKDRLEKGVGLTENLIKILEDIFFWRHKEILAFFVRARTRARIRHMNRKIMEPKKGTLRGRRKLVEWIF